MSRRSYKKAVEEHKLFQTTQEAIKHHVEMAMAHAFLFMEENAADSLISKLKVITLELLNGVPAKPLTPSKAVDTSNIPESTDIPEGNIISEERPRGASNTIVIKDMEEEKPLHEDEVIFNVPIGESHLSSRAKIIFQRAGYLTLGELKDLSNVKLKRIRGCGDDTVLDIIRVMKKYYNIDIFIEPKPAVPVRLRGPYKKRDDDRLNVSI